MIRPKEKEWVVVNTVYINGTGIDETYGYCIRNKDLKRRIVKLNTIKTLRKQGRLEINNARETSYISVPRDFKEQIENLL